jgi:hypothetical protein
MMRALTFNISAGNCSAYATNLTLQDKYQRVVQLIKQHDPHLISLQELDEMASQTIGGGLAADYTHLGSAESHCGSTHIWALNSLQASPMPSAGCVAMAKIPLPLPEGMSGTAGSAGYFVFAGKLPHRDCQHQFCVQLTARVHLQAATSSLSATARRCASSS